MSLTHRPAMFTVAVALTVAACGGARPGTEVGRIEALYHARTDSARMRYTPADVDFMTGMIAHHAQALIMADLAPSRDASSAIRTLTARIINAQRDEIAVMQQWLADRGQPVPAVHVEGLDVILHGVDAHHGHMPGMLTRAQLEDLARARGPAFDRLFLTYMIQHHEGAVHMVHTLFATDGAGQDEEAFKLASDIQVDQLTEIARMELMLEEMETSP